MLYFFAFAVFVPCNAVFAVHYLCIAKQPKAVATFRGKAKFNFKFKMYSGIIELVKRCPDISISVKSGELLEMVEYCVQTTRKELEQLIEDSNVETYPSPEQVAKILDVNKSTLWRWRKQGYLIPLTIGGKCRYRMSDVKRILEG